MIHDRVTGKSRGFGFVTFQESLAAEHALAEAHTIKGRRCDVKAAVPKVRKLAGSFKKTGERLSFLFYSF